jgi:hypothetical protein
MKAKRKKLTALRPLAEVIARDARNKKALDAEFGKFYALMKKTMTAKSGLKHLDIPLEAVKRAVQVAAWGEFFGDVMVEVVKHKD